MRTKNTKVALFPEVRREAPSMPSAQLATILACTADGALSVAVAGRGPTSARLAVPASADFIRNAVEQRQQAVLVFENGDPALPLIVGFVQQPAVDQPAKTPTVVEADVDGKRVCVSAQDEIVLKCGEASVTLRRNGRVLIRGTYVETHSQGTNRIKGGQVQIN